ncbi:hypothetical protein OSB04_022031 [Centaurea solstitialis]|uniref:Uncharacterized protein n=1 Tax=Centaurea solstitialis TaxID=347529 RepID=A0AA38TF53_9ASTR|nr:hypothetical protein OSB04_022031 [Centaurea solstitialis]
MATGSQAAGDLPAGRSGGKILKARRTAARKTPYDRPTSNQPQPPLLQSESPNWLALPAKFVAGGATKLFSSFWNPKSWSAPSSSSSSSDNDSESDDDSEDNEKLSDEVVELNQQQKTQTSQKSETLHLIEQLLMLEQYTREEGDRLIEIIRSQVVDYPMREDVDAGPSMTRGWTDNGINPGTFVTCLSPKLSSIWTNDVYEKKFRSGSKSDLDNGIYALKAVTTPQPTEGEAGSPVDVAKSYMRSRPPWASPISHNNSLSPSPLAADLFKEGTLYSSGGGTSFSSAKKDYLSAGSWNIQDEIRRLRSKATEDMLNSNRSLKLASSMLEHDTPKRSLASDKPISVTERDEPITSEARKSVDEIVNLAEGGTAGVSDTRTTQIDLPTEALPTMPNLEQYQGMDSVEMIENTVTSDNEQNISRASGDGNKLEKKEDGRQSAERNLDQESDGIVYDKADNNCYLMTQSTEIPLIPNSQDSSNNGDHTKAADDTAETRAVTRAGRHSRRAKGRV